MTQKVCVRQQPCAQTDVASGRNCVGRNPIFKADRMCELVPDALSAEQGDR